jgi:hypothetical protein
VYAPLFAAVKAHAPLTALIGSDPCRCYLFGEADPAPPARPYIVWQTIAGGPENCLAGVDDLDRYALQVDVYGETAASARQVAGLFRDAIAGKAYVTAFNGEFREAETGLYRVSLSVDWLTS